jgi:hypothetical protein
MAHGQDVNIAREQQRVAKVGTRTYQGDVYHDTYEYAGFEFHVTVLKTRSIYHITGLATRPNGLGGGTLVNMVLPITQNPWFIQDIIERIIVQHVASVEGNE